MFPFQLLAAKRQRNENGKNFHSERHINSSCIHCASLSLPFPFSHVQLWKLKAHVARNYTQEYNSCSIVVVGIWFFFIISEFHFGWVSHLINFFFFFFFCCCCYLFISYCCCRHIQKQSTGQIWNIKIKKLQFLYVPCSFAAHISFNFYESIRWPYTIYRIIEFHVNEAKWKVRATKRKEKIYL